MTISKKTNKHILVLGNKSVGKMTILEHFSDKKSLPNFLYVTGTDLRVKNMIYGTQRLKLTFWTEAGTEQFYSLAPIYYERADALVLVYDVTNRESFNQVGKWLRNLDRSFMNDKSLLLVGNKSDLGRVRQVEFFDGIQMAKEYDASFHEISAKNNIQVDALLDSILTQIMRPNMNNAESNQLHPDPSRRDMQIMAKT